MGVGFFIKKVDVSLRRMLVGLLLVFGAFFCFAQEGKTTTITITNARQTDYRKDPVSGNDTIVLTGNVELSVSKGSVSTEIKAEKITYDRKTEMLYAEGNVLITTKSSSAGGEKTTASALLMNTATLEGIFDDGRVVQTKSDALNLPSGSTLVVFSDVFGKTESNTIAFKNSSLTFCDDDNPHWKINATRTWLLPGGEFAFFNALLYVGPVPVLYLPAFYYPKDELIYNPSFGYREKEGYFVNTTIYLLGRKNLTEAASVADSSDSVKALYNFMKPTAMKEQERQGLMLHNLDEDYRGSTNNILKIDADLYSNLGVMLGTEGIFKPSEKYLTSLNFNFKLGFTNTIFRSNGKYVPFATDGTRYYDKSNFMGLKLPFRYGGNIDLSLSKPFKLNLNLPVYSDPSFVSDFNSRQESIDWITFLLGGNNTEKSTSEISSLAWKLSGSYAPTLPAAVKPYISSLNLTFNSTVNISAASTDLSGDKRYSVAGWKDLTPEKKFYYPSQITPANVSLTMNGTIFQWPKASSSTSTSRVTYPVALEKPDGLKKPSELEADAEKKRQEDEAAKIRAEAEEKVLKENPDATEDELKALVEAELKKQQEAEAEKVIEEVAVEERVEFIMPELPVLTASIPSVKTASGLSYKLGYTFTPSLVTQIAYSTTGLKTPEDFKWKIVKSFMYTAKTPASLSSSFSYGGNLISLTNKISYDSLWQDHPNTDGYNDTQRKSLLLADYNAEAQNITNTNSLSFKPFVYSSVFSDTGISWNSNMKLLRRKFVGDVENPEWENKGLDFEDAESVTSHNLSFILDAKESKSKYNQSFTYTTSLPPQVTKHDFALNLKFPYVTAGLSTGFSETSKTDSTLTFNPASQSLSVGLFDNKVKLSESFSYVYKVNQSGTTTDSQSGTLPEKPHPESLRFSVSWKTFSASYVMSYTKRYVLDLNNGWLEQDKKQFLPYSLSFSYSTPSKTFYRWKNRIKLTPSLSTSLVADLIRPTNTYLSITPNLTFKINEFFNITFASTSRNSVLYWYFNEGHYDKGLFGLDFFPFNMLQDLVNSYRFDSEDLRKGSGFKLKTLSMTVSHELDDWSFNMTWKFEPKINTAKKEYSYKPYISIGIVWTPMPSIKTTIVDDYGTWKMNGDK